MLRRTEAGEQLRAVFRPEPPGFHLYSIDLPAGGVDGLGVRTVLDVRGGLRATGRPSADVPTRPLRIARVIETRRMDRDDL